MLGPTCNTFCVVKYNFGIQSCTESSTTSKVKSQILYQQQDNNKMLSDPSHQFLLRSFLTYCLQVLFPSMSHCQISAFLLQLLLKPAHVLFSP